MKYFLHDSNAFNDEKVTELFMKFGYEGLGLFYTILERLAQQEQPMKTEVLKSQLKVGKRLEKCLKFMEEIGIVSSNNGETFNEKLLKFSEKYMIKKEKNRIRVANFREKQKPVTHYNCVRNAPKDKISKDKVSNTTNVVLQQAEYGKSEISWLLEEFENIMEFKSSSSRDRIFGNHLIKNYSKDQLLYMLNFCSNNEYAPRIGSLEKMWFKRGDIIAGIKSEHNKNNKNLIVEV